MLEHTSFFGSNCQGIHQWHYSSSISFISQSFLKTIKETYLFVHQFTTIDEKTYTLWFSKPVMLKCLQCLFRHQIYHFLKSDMWMSLPEMVCTRPFFGPPDCVDLWGLEPQTFGMQIRRSSQLSYRPSATRSIILNAKKTAVFFNSFLVHNV